MPQASPRQALAGLAAGLAAACLTLTSTVADAGQVRSHEWWLRTLHVTQAWRSSHGSGVTVAVLDTGVDPHQADLTRSVTTGRDFTGSGEARGSLYWGVHGTAMASLIAGHGHGAKHASGIMGVAPAARILSVRVTLEGNDPLLANPTITGGLPGAIARGIRYAVKHHASVIDLPLDPVTRPGAPGVGGSRSERAAVRYAIAHHVVLVAPAGDRTATADPVNYPAAYPGVISVGAFDSSFVKAPFSSRRSYVTLTAAGNRVVAATPPTGYSDLNSTSAASAIVAGVVALIRSQFPHLTPAQIRQVLTGSTVYRRPGGRRTGSGYGAVDAAAALAAAARMVEAVPSPGASAGSGVPSAHAPTPPAIRPTGTTLGHMIRNDAGVALGVFALLLVAILGFGWMQRRRARAARLAAVRAAAQAPLRQPGKAGQEQATGAGNGAGSAGYLAAPESAFPQSAFPATPGTARGPVPGPDDLDPWRIRPEAGQPAAFRNTAFSRSVGGGPGAMGSGTDPARLTPDPARLTPDPDPAPDPLAGGRGAPPGTSRAGRHGGGDGNPGGANVFVPPAGGAGGGAGQRPAGSGTGGGGRSAGGQRPGSPRPPRVSGRPPWDTAGRPDGDVPWGQPPRSSGTGTSLPQRLNRPPEMSVWDAIAEEAWPGGPQTGRPVPTADPAPDSQAPDATSDAPAAEPRPDSGHGEGARAPYLWSPSETTETFHTVPGDTSGTSRVTPAAPDA